MVGGFFRGVMDVLFIFKVKHLLLFIYEGSIVCANSIATITFLNVLEIQHGAQNV
jgi:hypothetical protein